MAIAIISATGSLWPTYVPARNVSLTVKQIITIIFLNTIVHLRYFLGGHRPSETTHHKLSSLELVLNAYKNTNSTDASHIN